MSKEKSTGDTALRLHEGEQILWQGRPSEFPYNEKAGMKNLIVMWGLGPLILIAVMAAYLTNGGKLLSIINIFLVLLLVISIFSPMRTKRTIMGQYYYVTDERAIVTMDGFEQFFVRLEDIDDVQIESDSVQDNALIIGSVLFPEIKKQLRWRACNAMAKDGSKETGQCAGLIFYGLKDADAAAAIAAMGK